MNLSIYMRFWGGLDVAYVLWRVFKDVLESKIPFFSSFVDPLNVAVEFGQTSILIMTAVSAVITLSIVVSGPLMLFLRRSGVYVSIVQFPFRLTLFIPPTFFFIQSAKDYLPSLLLVAVILILEVVKLVTEIFWLKRSKGVYH